MATTHPSQSGPWRSHRAATPRLDPPPIGIAIFLGVLALVFPLLGPATWVYANEQLDRVARGFAARRGVGWLAFARACGMLATYCVLAAIAALVVILL